MVVSVLDSDTLNTTGKVTQIDADNNRNVNIHFPRHVIPSDSQNNDVSLQMAYFSKNPCESSSPNKTDSGVLVLSLVSSGTEIQLSNRQHPVVFNLLGTYEAKEDGNYCVHWNEELGNWNDDGERQGGCAAPHLQYS